jgi:hypothetical protein
MLVPMVNVLQHLALEIRQLAGLGHRTPVSEFAGYVAHELFSSSAAVS